jgi:hypothetical protein
MNKLKQEPAKGDLLDQPPQLPDRQNVVTAENALFYQD